MDDLTTQPWLPDCLLKQHITTAIAAYIKLASIQWLDHCFDKCFDKFKRPKWSFESGCNHQTSCSLTLNKLSTSESAHFSVIEMSPASAGSCGLLFSWCCSLFEWQRWWWWWTQQSSCHSNGNSDNSYSLDSYMPSSSSMMLHNLSTSLDHLGPRPDHFGLMPLAF